MKGLICAPFTAFDENGDVDLARIPAQAEYYKRNGIAGVFICGTTGEGSALTVEEKKAIYEAWAPFRAEDFAIIGFLGGTSTRECIALARHARAANLDAVAVTAPYYQKAADVKVLVRTLAEVAAGVPDMPLFYYHIPCLTHVAVKMIDLLREADSLIPNFAGIKYTFEDMMDYQLCLEFKERKYRIMWGRDEMLLPALSIGADTFVGSTYGYNAPIYLEIIRAFREGRMADAAILQYEANRIIDVLCRYGNGAGKAFMKAAGFDLGPCRLPLSTMPEDVFVTFLKALEDTRFDEFRCR